MLRMIQNLTICILPLALPAALEAQSTEPADQRSYFIEQCEDPKDDATEKAIERLLATAGTRDCTKAKDVLFERPALQLTNIGIRDVQLLLEFTKVQFVDVSGNEIPDICPLAKLPNLIHLLANRNLASKIGCLKDIKRLATLEVAENQIVDGSVIADMPNLEGLDISSNPILFLNFSRNNSLINYLAANNLGITDLSELKGLSGMQMLRLSGNSITDLSALKDMAKLQWLDLSHNRIADLTALADKPQLQVLDLSHNQVSDLAPLQSSEALVSLRLKGNKIAELPELNVPKLLILELSANAFTSTASLRRLHAPLLNRFTLSANKIRRVLPGDFPQHSFAIDLSGNEITNVMFAAGYPQLEELMLAGNNIRNIMPLAAAKGLKRLSLAANNVTSVAPLIHVEALRYVNMDENPLGTTITKTPANCPTTGPARPIVKWCLQTSP